MMLNAVKLVTTAKENSPHCAAGHPRLDPDSPTETRFQVWACVRAQQKREHIAAANLRRYLGIEVFNPRFRFRKATRRGLVWTTEPVFPGYLFARFDLSNHLEAVKYTAGVRTVVHFGDKIPVIPEEVIAELRQGFRQTDVQEVSDALEEDDEVSIAFGTFCGLKAVVLRTMSASSRVRVLIEFLGHAATLDLPRAHLIKEGTRELIARHVGSPHSPESRSGTDSEEKGLT